MACCCCDGPGVCCQGTTCTSVGSCQCQQNGGTFKAGRTCQQADICCCPGQLCTQVDLCGPCDCIRKPSPCGCRLKSQINLTINFTYGGEELYRQYFENAMQAASGAFTLNLVMISGGSCIFTYQYLQNKDGLEDPLAPQIAMYIDTAGLVVVVGQTFPGWFYATDFRTADVPSQFFCDGQQGSFSGTVQLVGEVPGPNIPVGSATYSF
jgi:hypothetical protein